MARHRGGDDPRSALPLGAADALRRPGPGRRRALSGERQRPRRRWRASDRTRLVIVADPAITDHIVEIEAEGAFGRFHFREEVKPTKDNPKTGLLVAMAITKTIRQLASPVVIGA